MCIDYVYMYEDNNEKGRERVEDIQRGKSEGKIYPLVLLK